jgi:hypothetical protein
MNIKFSINKKLDKQDIHKKLRLVLFKSMLKMHELAIINCPVDTGRLSNSINLDPKAPGFTEYILSDGVEYGSDVEYGTSPHVVSAKHLKGWARRVLKKESLAYPVAAKIRRFGTEAQPFFRPALHQVKNIWVERYYEEIL